MVKIDKYLGCFLGLAIGDAYGASYEGGAIERFLWRAIGKTKDGKIRYTDDTQMSIDLASSFIKSGKIDQEDLAKTFANSYRFSRGYGPSAAWLLKKIKNGANWQDVNRVKFKEGSFGNGAAMRAPILAMCFSEHIEKLEENVLKSSEITHAHPLAIEGAELVAFTTFGALYDWSNKEIFKTLQNLCKSSQYKTKVLFCIESVKSQNKLNNRVLKNKLGNSISATESSVTAIYFALKYRAKEYSSMLNDIYTLGGDTDTIGAMAGAIWGAFNGSKAIDQNRIDSIENSQKIIELSKQLYDKCSSIEHINIK